MLTKPVNLQELEEGQQIAIYNQLTDTLEMGVVISISPNLTSALVFGRESGKNFFNHEGWMFQKESRYNMRLVELNDELKTKIHREELLQIITSIIWEVQDVVILEKTVSGFEYGKRLVKEQQLRQDAQ